MKHIKKMKIDIDKKNFEVIPSVQYDSNTRYLHINLLNGAVPFNLTGCSVKISGTKQDGTAIFNNCTVINAKEGFIEVELTEQMNAAPGTLKCELKLYSGSGVLTTKHFEIEVTASVTSKNITSGNEFKALTDALEVVQTIENKADKEKVEKQFDAVYKRLDNVEKTMYTKSDLETLIREIITAINSENPVADSNDRYLYLGNSYEAHPYTFKKGYVYKLTSLSTCLWCNKTGLYTIDSTSTNKIENLQGIYKIETYKDNIKVIPPVDFINSASLYMFLNFTKNQHDILFIGDSLSDISFQTFQYNYLSRLAEKYKTKYNFITHIPNFGHTVSQQMACLNKFTAILSNSNNGIENIYTKDKVKIVSIFVGTNDIDHATQTFEQFTEKYVEMINHIKTNFKQAKILLITPFLCKKTSNAIKYINKIKELGRNNNCEVVDLSAFTELNSVTTGYTDYYLEEECIHLTKKGWDLINDTIVNGYKNIGIDTIYLTPPTELEDTTSPPSEDIPSSGSSNNLEWKLGNINAGDGSVLVSSSRAYSSLVALNVNDVITTENGYSFQCYAYNKTTEEFVKYITGSWVKTLTINNESYKYRFVVRNDSNTDLISAAKAGKKLNIN